MGAGGNVFLHTFWRRGIKTRAAPPISKASPAAPHMTEENPTDTSVPEAHQQPERRPSIVLRPQAPEVRRPPLYRVVEVVRTPYGRLEEEGKVWHSDLAHVRRFGRAIAGNTSGHRVVVVDGAGTILEELSVVPQQHRDGSWEGWKETTLPPLPHKRSALRSKPRAAPVKPMPPVPPVLAAPPPEHVEATDTQPAELQDEVVLPSGA